MQIGYPTIPTHGSEQTTQFSTCSCSSRLTSTDPWFLVNVLAVCRMRARAARRAAQGLTDSIAERDRKDSARACAPLTKADDAQLVDTSDMSIEQVVATIAADIRNRMA